jgi:ATP:ADP antiporter, AAA family
MDRRALYPFLICITLCSFLITAEYSITRPVSNALFLNHFTSKMIPYAWLISMPFNLLVITLYSYLLPRWGSVRLFTFATVSVMALSLSCAFFAVSYPYLSFLHYIWKDVYILLMFKQLWSLIHSSMDTHKNKYLYSLLFGIGGLGSMCGSMFPSFLAVKVGSENLFFMTLPLYASLMFMYRHASKRANVHYIKEESHPSKWHGFSLVRSSKYLTCLLLIVIFMQMVTALTDFQFNTILEKEMATVDLKSKYCGQVMLIVNSSSLFFQLIGSLFLIKILGMRFAHFFIPLALGCNALTFFLFPTFGVISYSYAVLKVFDFSMFNVVREMLYSPLDEQERYFAKSVIDVFAYRSAKAFASVLIVGIPFLFNTYIITSSSLCLFAIFIFWLFILHILFKQEKAKVLLHS